MLRAPLTVAATPVLVSQGSANTVTTTLGAGALTYPPLGDPQLNLGNIPEVWGFRRNLWETSSTAFIAGKQVFPMQRTHRAATSGSGGVCAVHFNFSGQVFELLFAGFDARVTLIADGQYMASRIITTTLGGGTAGTTLSPANKFVRFDFGSAAPRRISVYALSSQGPCALAVGPNDRIQAWDRSGEASFGGMADSYGAALHAQWGGSGPFWAAAAKLGIPHVDLDALGGTGYAPNNTNADSRNAGNAFPARLPSNVNAQPDLFLTAGGINDNNSIAALPLYATAADALAGFNAGVRRYYSSLRAALPDAVLAALGPWNPKPSAFTDPIQQSKAETIQAELRRVGGPWIFIDNLHGGWTNSAGASGAASGPWQTGTGNSTAPTGDGNGDLYLSADGVHPNEAGTEYLATKLATDLRAALLAL